MANPDSSSVRDLSSGQVRSLLSVGLSSHRSHQAESDAPSAEDIMAADPQLLAQVIEDLKTPCPDDGPFSIFRLCGVEPASSASLRNQSWLTLLTSRDTSRETLQCMEEAGRLLSQPGLSELTGLAAALIRLLATDALKDRQGDFFNRLSSEKAGEASED
ncbi:MAG: hypothetical protein O3B13_24615 [Planctomycetota bacterium]|nr:hypothetical protein [Planctomycetota bacterium]